jgi:DNA polymerase III epsilon subunit-like protein
MVLSQKKSRNANFIVDYGVMYNDSEVICTFKISEEIKEKNKSLTALCKRYRIESFEAHRALTDVQALERLWDKEYCKYRHKTNGSKLSDFVGEMSSMKVRFPKVFK